MIDNDFVAGQIVVVDPFPFLRTEYEHFDGDGVVRMKSWKPGAEIKETQYGEEVWANGSGKMLLTVVSTFKPGRFPTRVFYTRKFVAPDGRTFGKDHLRIATVHKFKQISKSYRYHFEIVKAA